MSALNEVKSLKRQRKINEGYASLHLLDEFCRRQHKKGVSDDALAKKMKINKKELISIFSHNRKLTVAMLVRLYWALGDRVLFTTSIQGDVERENKIELGLP